jgi:hypothetical protein
MFNSKIDSNLDMTKVKALYDHYHAKTKTNPTLYQSGDECITVILPQGLLDYCNASAGNSGGSNARPCGIRYSVRNSTKALEQIFESVDSLARFISGSDCDGMYFAERTARDAEMCRAAGYFGRLRRMIKIAVRYRRQRDAASVALAAAMWAELENSHK